MPTWFLNHAPNALRSGSKNMPPMCSFMIHPTLSSLDKFRILNSDVWFHLAQYRIKHDTKSCMFEL